MRKGIRVLGKWSVGKGVGAVGHLGKGAICKGIGVIKKEYATTLLLLGRS